MSKKHQETEKLLCIPQEQRSSSMKVGETPGNGEESPSFGEEPRKVWENGNDERTEKPKDQCGDLMRSKQNKY